MPNSERIQQLLQFHQEEPKDPFVIYALALEYQNTNDQKALLYFDKLLQDHPDYLPTYLHAASYLIDLLEDKTKIINIFEKGINLAKQKQDQHALSELQNAYQNYLIDIDE
ncbi:tetratricopeptide repeat protein [Penaeicola halotolerans]|uniref:tetratricopeptide repeat protein n=1 Tax=Penaeicola halotolerans TaxID=2793196 RepID=UPI001CF8F368|nr:tetratricopeptide repeat protein [Penaeicola halotolerans]